MHTLYNNALNYISEKYNRQKYKFRLKKTSLKLVNQYWF